MVCLPFPQSAGVSLLDLPQRIIPRRVSLPASFAPLAIPSAQASTSGKKPVAPSPVAPRQRLRPTSLPTRLSDSRRPVTFVYQTWGRRRRRLARYRFTSSQAQDPAHGQAHDQAHDQNQQQARSTSGRDSLFDTSPWEELEEDTEEEVEEKVEEEVDEQAKEDEKTKKLIAASYRRFPFRDPPRGDGPTVFTLSERLEVAQPRPCAQRPAQSHPYPRRPPRQSFIRSRATVCKRQAPARPSLKRPLSTYSSSGDADNEASDTPPSSSSNPDNNNKTRAPPGSFLNKPSTTISYPPMHPADRHASTLANPRLHASGFARPPPSRSGAGPGPVFRTLDGRLPAAEPRRRKSYPNGGGKRDADGKAKMPLLYLRMTEGGYLTLSEGESRSSSSSSSSSSASGDGDGRDKGEGGKVWDEKGGLAQYRGGEVEMEGDAGGDADEDEEKAAEADIESA